MKTLVIRTGRTWRATGLAALYAVVFAATLTAAGPAVRGLAFPLEARFASAPAPQQGSIAGIVVLGGSAERLPTTIAMATRYPGAKVILTGAGEDVAAAYLLSHGVTPARLVREVRSRTTFQNAAFTAALLHPEASQHYLLITSPVHMPRAVGVFRKAGFTVDPWPARGRGVELEPPAAAVEHEWIGLLAYRLLGRTDDVFPALDWAHPSAHAELPVAGPPES